MVAGQRPEQHVPHTHAAHGLHCPISHWSPAALHVDALQHCCHVPPQRTDAACSSTLCSTMPSG
jgi:hypothetical protein